MLIALDKPFVKEYLYVKQAVVMENIKLLWEAVGGNLDIVGLEGFDFGTQNGEMISPLGLRRSLLASLQRAI